MTGPVRRIVGREHELEVLNAAIDAAGSAGSAIAVCGEPGIGKSVLLQAAARRGQERGHLVLRATGVEAESQLPFAGLHELIRPVLGAADALAPPQRRALLSAFGIGEEGSPEPFLICLAALNVLTGVAARQPVAVIVDDLQWLDQPSQDVAWCRQMCRLAAWIVRRCRPLSLGISLRWLPDWLPEIYLVSLMFE